MRVRTRARVRDTWSMVFYLVFQAQGCMLKGDKDKDLSIEELEELVEEDKFLEDGSDPEDVDVL